MVKVEKNVEELWRFNNFFCTSLLGIRALQDVAVEVDPDTSTFTMVRPVRPNSFSSTTRLDLTPPLAAMSLDQSHYDVAIFSTGLTQSIISAALASAGLSVIHIDRNDYYADQWASLTLTELLRWAQDITTANTESKQRPRRVDEINLSFPAFDTADANKPGESSKLPDRLASLDRHYAISLAPTLLPATGASIDCLIRSKVSSYATFRLLERTCVASKSERDSAQMTLTSVPASKEDIFKTKILSLIAKRKLMKLLMYIGSEDWQSDLAQDPEKAQKPFVKYLAEEHKMSPDLVDAVAYGVCLCATPEESTQEAMARAKSHMQSVGRYGNSAYLVGQYGGAGELAQGYCRASAVKGGMFILAHPIKAARRTQDDKWEIEVDGIETKVTANYVVSSDEVLEELDTIDVGSEQAAASQPESVVLHRAVLVLDSPIQFGAPSSEGGTTNAEQQQQQQDSDAPQLPPETGLVIFPPGSIGGNANTVTVLMMGEGTFSCPKGQYVYYVQTEAYATETGRSALETLKPVLDQIIALTADATQPLLQLTYRQLIPASAPNVAEPNLSSICFPPRSIATVNADSQPVTSILGLTDAAVHLAEKIYHDILASQLAPSTADNTHEDKVQWVKHTLEQQKLERKRRKGRDASEYQGRGGRGEDDGVTKAHPLEDAENNAKEEHTTLVGFFETNTNEYNGDDDDDDDDN